MKISVKRASDKILAIIFSVVTLALILSITANIAIGHLAYVFYTQQRITTVPMVFDKAFTTTLNSADGNYMNMAALSFITLRLNVTPETVDGQHKQLLYYVPSEHRSALKNALSVESDYIKKNGVSTVFYSDSITIEPTSGALIFKGTLKSSTSTGQLPDVPKAYRLDIRYHNGKPDLEEFTELPYLSVK